MSSDPIPLPRAYTVLGLCVVGALLALFGLVGFGVGWPVFLVCLALSGLGLHDLRQTAPCGVAQLPGDRPPAVLPPHKQHKVFRQYWLLASAHGFRADGLAV